MEAITYQNIVVAGVPFTKILNLSITQGVNDHGQAVIDGEVDQAEGTEFIKRTDETTMIKITTTAEGQPPVLFCGVVADVSMGRQSDYATLRLVLDSTSQLLDRQKNKKSFQNTGMTYEAILNQVVGSTAMIHMEVSDRPIGNLIMQFNETNWEFIKRMASEFSAPIVTNVNTEIPQITIGIPKSEKIRSLETTESSHGASGEYIAGHAFMFAGDAVNTGGEAKNVQKITSSFDRGILVSQVQPQAPSAMVQPQIANTQASGKMFTGIVQAVELDKVQAHLVDVDSSYDGGTTHWFPYSTAYSSSDGSGFYCMPEVGDTVRVFFPSDQEGQAFAASSVNVLPLTDPKHKKWRSPAGKEILMTEKGILITCEKERIFIDLSVEKGITIQADKEVNIVSSTNMLLLAPEVVVEADQKVLLSTASSYIDIQKDKIELGADNVIIN